MRVLRACAAVAATTIVLTAATAHTAWAASAAKLTLGVARGGSTETGQAVTYAYTVTNTGGTAAAGPVTLTVTFDAGQLSFLAGTAGWTCPGAGAVSPVVCALGSLAAGASTTVTLSFRVTAPAGASVTVTAVVASPDEIAAGAKNTAVAAPFTVTPAAPPPPPPPNVPPVALPDATTTPSGTPVVLDVLANDSDADGGTLSLTTLAPVPTTGDGTVACTAAGACTVTPAAGYAGPLAFGYTVADGQGGTAQGTAEVTVLPAEPSPSPTSVSPEPSPSGIVEVPSPEPTPSIGAGASPEPSPSETIEVSASPEPSPSELVEASASPEPSPSEPVEASASPEPSPSEIIEVSASPEPSAPPANLPPEFDGSPTNVAQMLAVGAAPVALAAADPEGDELAFAVVGGALPPGVHLLPDGSFGGAATAPQPVAGLLPLGVDPAVFRPASTVVAGVFTASVTVSDPAGGSDTTELTITLLAPAGPPDGAGDPDTGPLAPVGPAPADRDPAGRVPSAPELAAELPRTGRDVLWLLWLALELAGFGALLHRRRPAYVASA